MSTIEDLITYVSPAWAVKRARARSVLAAYEAANPGRLRKEIPEYRGPNSVVGAANIRLRGYARNLEQNHDLARGVLDALVNNTIGPNGISVEPMPRKRDGTINTKLAKQLSVLFKEFIRKPEVTWTLSLGMAERMLARTLYRDGEALAQHLEGSVPLLDHGTTVPYSLELIEPDLLPLDYTDIDNGILQGVQRNSWNRPTAYHIYKQHPNDASTLYTLNTETKAIAAARMVHLKLADRVNQVRGVSVFASVMKRLEDVKDYEQSERVAARVAAAMTAYIKRGDPGSYEGITNTSLTNRSFNISPGMVFDGLQPGEEIATIESKRPSTLLAEFRNDMLRAVASGTGSNYSTIARRYDGTYSAQRQELVEGFVNYSALTRMFVMRFTSEVYERFVKLAVVSGAISVPRAVDPLLLIDADYRGPVMPWVDPVKEAQGLQTMIESRLKSPQQAIRERGDSPTDVLDQFEQWENDLTERGLNNGESKDEGATVVETETDPGEDEPGREYDRRASNLR